MTENKNSKKGRVEKADFLGTSVRTILGQAALMEYHLHRRDDFRESKARARQLVDKAVAQLGEKGKISHLLSWRLGRIGINSGSILNSIADTIDTRLHTEFDGDFLQWLGTGGASVKKQTDFPNNFEFGSDGARDYFEVIVPGLANKVTVVPKNKRLILKIADGEDPAFSHNVAIPYSGEEGLEWIKDDDVYGRKDEAMVSQCEVFGAISGSGFTEVLTHSTGERNLPGILASGSINATRFRNRASYTSGINFEIGTLGPPNLYADTLCAFNDRRIPRQAPVEKKDGSPSFVSSQYIDPKSSAPIVLVDKAIENDAARNVLGQPFGVGVEGSIKLDDQYLIGIWVTPTYRKLLLEWIDSWPEEKKKESFGGRDPATVLISEASDIPISIH